MNGTILDKLSTWDCIVIIVVALLLIYAIIGPWLSLFKLSSLEDIGRELRKIRELLERRDRSE